jgi:hypothetical protein
LFITACADYTLARTDDLPLPEPATPAETYTAPEAPKPRAVPARLAKPSSQATRIAKPAASHTHPSYGRGDGRNSINKLSDLYSRASFAMQVGQNAEAIAAFEEVLRLNANFTDASGRLALLYLKEGEVGKSIEAFKHAKRFGDANGGTVTRDGSGGLQFP